MTDYPSRLLAEANEFHQQHKIIMAANKAIELLSENKYIEAELIFCDVIKAVQRLGRKF